MSAVWKIGSWPAEFVVDPLLVSHIWMPVQCLIACSTLSRIPWGGPHMAESGGGDTGFWCCHGGSSSCGGDGGAVPGLACAGRLVGSGRSGSGAGDLAVAAGLVERADCR